MAHIFAVSLCAIIVYLARPGTSLFSWHPTFMILGFGLFMFEAILIFSPHSSLLASSSRAVKVKYHWVLQVGANVFIVLGFAAIYYNKNLNSKPHFTSWHGFVGGVAVAVSLVQSITAISLMYYNVALFNPLGMTLGMRKRLHGISGALSFVVGYVALVLSMYSKFMEKNCSENMWYVLLVLMVVVSSVVVNQVSAKYILPQLQRSPPNNSGNIKVQDGNTAIETHKDGTGERTSTGKGSNKPKSRK